MTLLETIKNLDKKRQEVRRAAEYLREREERERQHKEQENFDVLYQDFEVFVGKDRYIVNTRFIIYPPDFACRQGAIKIDWKISELNLHNNEAIVLKHNDLKLAYFQIINAIKNSVIDKLISDIQNNIQIYACWDVIK